MGSRFFWKWVGTVVGMGVKKLVNRVKKWVNFGVNWRGGQKWANWVKNGVKMGRKWGFLGVFAILLWETHINWVKNGVKMGSKTAQKKKSVGGVSGRPKTAFFCYGKLILKMLREPVFLLFLTENRPSGGFSGVKLSKLGSIGNWGVQNWGSDWIGGSDWGLNRIGAQKIE